MSKIYRISAGKCIVSVTLFVFLFCSKLCGIEIKRVIMATNNNPMYIEFWPVVAPLWQEMGFRPTLALIADESCKVDTTIGDVIRFSPIPGVSEALQAQCVRLLLPALYPDEGCIISDIDMLPISRSYFVEGANQCPEDTFLVYRDKAYDPTDQKYPMCYFTAKGSIFGSIFGVSNYDQISPLIKEWSNLGLGWSTDELVLYKTVNKWKSDGGKVILLGHSVGPRLDRSCWDSQMKSFNIKDYIDCHCPRPYSTYRDSIDQVATATHIMLKTQDQAKSNPDIVYNQIKDIRHPTLEDYKLIQSYLTTDIGGMIRPLGDDYADQNLKGLKILGPAPSYFQSGVIAVNCDSSCKENCLIVYSTYNKNFAQGVSRLVQKVANSDFKGHIIYRTGGWPNVEDGDLVLAHVPYAFKVCAFREARRLGYKRAFWLDSPAVPKISLNDVFKIIADKGYYVMGNQHMVGPYMNATAAAFFDLSLEETQKIPSCSAGIFGVDFTNEKTSKIIDLLYLAAKSKDGFQSRRSDQNALSIILYKLQLNDFVPHKNMLVYFDWIR